MDEKVVAHFKKVDPLLYSYIHKIESFEFGASLNKDYFSHLCDAIISQQLSEKAGATIWLRFKKLFSNEDITPQELLKIPDDTIRAAGSSWAKIRALKDLAQKVQEKKLNLDELPNLSDEDVITQLTQVRGIGRWTAEMFLMFALGKEDIFSHGDLGLKRAIQKIYGFEKEPTVKQVERIIAKWSPYKTYACRILWKSLMIK
jgi:DNA-3-methyladenine glycosylase II